MRMRVEGTLFSCHIDGSNSSISIAGGFPLPVITIPITECHARRLMSNVGKDVRLIWVNGEIKEIKCGDSLRLRLSPSF
jgi:hypothetical protein